MKVKNPIVRSDFPDLDVIRVGDTYYMVSTTMHMMPGGVILKSYDLFHWEICSYIYDKLGDTDRQNLNGGNIYGAGMWAASLRYHEGKFYICFVANDTRLTYLITATDIENGPYEMHNIEGFYHDCSLLFDNGHVYIAYGGGHIMLTELKPDLSAPLPGGLHREIVTERENVGLPYEGTHIYKINGKYYAFFIHWLADGSKRRVEACFMSDSLEGEWHGGNVFDCAGDGRADGIAQGGIVDTPDGKTYAVLFQDYGALGRIPYLIPVRWENDFPVFDTENYMEFEIDSAKDKEDYVYAPLVDSDNFDYAADEDGKVKLSKVWQWNHNPKDELWKVENKGLYIKTDRVVTNPTMALNTLTQRTMAFVTDCSVNVDASSLNDGDFAGLIAFQGGYGAVCITKEDGRYFAVMLERDSSVKGYEQKIIEKLPLDSAVCGLRVVFDFTGGRDEAEFYILCGDEYRKIGGNLKMRYTLDHFMGYRVGLCCYSTKNVGGSARFEVRDHVFSSSVYLYLEKP